MKFGYVMHNQGSRFNGIRITGQMLQLQFIDLNGLKPSVAKASLILRLSALNSGCLQSKSFQTGESAGCLNNPSFVRPSTCHHASLAAFGDMYNF